MGIKEIQETNKKQEASPSETTYNTNKQANDNKEQADEWEEMMKEETEYGSIIVEEQGPEVGTFDFYQSLDTDALSVDDDNIAGLFGVKQDG